MPARRIGGHSQWLPGRAASGCTVAADALWRAGWPSPRLPAPTARGCFHAHNQLRQLPDCPARGDGSLPLSGTTCQVRSSKSRLAHALGGSGDSILSIDARVVHAAMHHLTYPRNRAGERRCEGWVVGRRQVTCSAVSGKSLARGAPAWSSLARTPAPSSRQPWPHATGISGASLSSNEGRTRPARKGNHLLKDERLARLSPQEGSLLGRLG
jgi:hypothetical protein